MNAPEMMRLIDSISRDRNVDKELLIEDLEQAMVSAARKHFNVEDPDEFRCEIDRLNGEIKVWRHDEPITLESLGRIPAQTAKQVMIQRFREDERASIYNEFIDRVGELTTGTAQRYEGGALVVQIGRAEGFMPRSEQIPGEQHQPGERVRCLILDVRDTGSQVKIVLSRASPDVIKRLFEVEVPEVAERIIEMKALAREAGHRTKIAVSSIDSKVDAVGACVGVRGSRIKNIVDELGGEKIDIVRWNESSQILIQNSLKPAEVVEISLCFELGRATVVVHEDQLSLAIGKRGQNVRLAARLTNWDIDILTPAEFSKSLDIMEETLNAIEGISEQNVDRLAALGVISVFDVEEVGVPYLTETLEIDQAIAEEAVRIAAEKGKEVAEQQAKEKEEQERLKREAEEAAARGETEPATAGDLQAAAILGGLGGGLGGPAPAPSADGEAPTESENGDTPVEHADDGHDSTDIAAEAGEQRIGSTDHVIAGTASRDDDDGENRSADAGELGEEAVDREQPAPDDRPQTVAEQEAEQQGDTGEMLADATEPEAGAVADTPDEAELRAATSRASQDNAAAAENKD